MEEILLSSENFIKSVTNISDNVNGKYILPALREAQEIDLKGIIGSTLLETLKILVADDAVELQDNSHYKDLIEQCQYFLAYTVVARLCVITSYKINNVCVNKASDENMEVVSLDEVYNIQSFYQKKADHYCSELQNFLLENRSKYPELNSNQCYKIKDLNSWH